MGDATVTSATIRPEEAAHFGGLANDWWDPKGRSAMLHRLGPVRLDFIRAAIDRHWPESAEALRPLEGKTALDAGCGAGLLTEPLARLGAMVTGIDAAPENIAAAAAHAEAMELDIRYMAGEVADCDPGRFDLIIAMEVLEHVADKAAFLAVLSRCLAPGGLLILSTPNRTLSSRALLVAAAEAVGAIPRGTHDWNDFITPEELDGLLASAGLQREETQGIAFSPMKGFHLSPDLSLNYILTARHG